MKKDTVRRLGAKEKQEWLAMCTQGHAADVEAFFHAVRGKWKIPILASLAGGTWRFNELQRHLAGVTQKVLTAQLRQLETDGLVLRKVYAQVPPRVEYSLTAEGVSLFPVIQSTSAWGHQHRQRTLGAESKQAVS